MAEADERQGDAQATDFGGGSHVQADGRGTVGQAEHISGEAFAEHTHVSAFAFHWMAGATVASDSLAGTARHIEIMLAIPFPDAGDVDDIAGTERERFGHIGSEVDAPVGVESDVATAGDGDDLRGHGVGR